VVGKLGDVFGLRFGMLAILLPIAYVLGVGLWAKPLINNATLSDKTGSAGSV